MKANRHRGRVSKRSSSEEILQWAEGVKASNDNTHETPMVPVKTQPMWWSPLPLQPVTQSRLDHYPGMKQNVSSDDSRWKVGNVIATAVPRLVGKNGRATVTYHIYIYI